MSAEQQSSNFNSTMEREVDELLNDSLFSRPVQTRNEALGDANEIASSIGTTPDPLNTAFINEETTNINEQHRPISLSQQQSQTTKEASSTIHGLISRIIEQEDEEVIYLHAPTQTMISTGTMPRTPPMKTTDTIPSTSTMISTGTMPKTPTTKTTGTMPQTPTMKTTGTMPKTPTTTKTTGTMPQTPTMKTTGTMPQTPIMKTTGTMPQTPTMKTTGTMPQTPVMASTGTMPQTSIVVSIETIPRTLSTTTSSSESTNETIDRDSPNTPTDTNSPN